MHIYSHTHTHTHTHIYIYKFVVQDDILTLSLVVKNSCYLPHFLFDGI